MAHLSHNAAQGGAVEARLAGIEAELRLMRNVLERMARVEERTLHYERLYSELKDDSETARKAMQDDLAALRERLDAVTASSARSSWAVGGIERLGWIVMTALAGLMAALVGKKFGA